MISGNFRTIEKYSNGHGFWEESVDEQGKIKYTLVAHLNHDWSYAFENGFKICKVCWQREPVFLK
jgi:hypothetical protein